MFKSNILMTGKHAEYMKKYSIDKQAEEQFEFQVFDNKGSKKTIYIFSTMIQAYMCAAMLGIIENKCVTEDKSSSVTANIFADIVMKNTPKLERIVQFMILSSDEVGTDQKIKEAFTINKDEAYIQNRLTSYARGGLEIIDSYFSDCQIYSDVAYKMLNLIDDYELITIED